jgi:hypothetical protein
VFYFFYYYGLLVTEHGLNPWRSRRCNPAFSPKGKGTFSTAMITARFKPDGKIVEKAGKPEDDRQAE